MLGPQNPRIAELRRLIGRRSSRSPEIVLEGPRTVGEALTAGISVATLIVPESAYDKTEVRNLRREVGDETEVLVVRDRVFERLAPSVTPQPVLAIALRPPASLPAKFGEDDLALVLVDIADPGNVGTIIRVADAAGACGVVCVGGADPWGTKAVRSSAGSVLRVPVVMADDLGTATFALRSAGARVVATDVRDGEVHDGGVLAGPVAIVLGSEPRGLDRSIGRHVDAWTRIDMAGDSESLNVAMAATLLAFEARRASR